MKKSLIRTSIIASIIAISVLSLYYPINIVSSTSISSSPRIINVTAKQFSFTPEVIHLNVGEEVIFRVVSADVTHGFYIDGFDFFENVSIGEPIEVGPLKFDKPGKFKIRCAIICGPLHPFMVADIIVEPNIFFYLFALTTVALGISTLIYFRKPRRKVPLFTKLAEFEIDILKIKIIGPFLKKFIMWRGFHFFVILPNLFIFMIVIVSGLYGNPMGALNFSIAVVWILWFAAIEVIILFASRTWAMVCPMPVFGEWIARRRLYGVNKLRNWFSLDKKWPEKLDNMWIPALGFLGMSLIIPWLVTRPIISALLFLLLIVVGLITHLIFPKRIFCRHICPASGYIGYHSNSSFFAVRSKDMKICDECSVKSCMKGGAKGYGCPWTLYPGGLEENVYCGQCFECLKSCPLDNMTLKYRMIDKDIETKVHEKADEAWMGFIRFTLAIFYVLVFFGPNFWIKDWGNMGVNFGANLESIGLLVPTFQGFSNWLLWAIIVCLVTLVIFPAAFFGFSALAKKVARDTENSRKRVFLAFSYSLTSFGHMLWLAFALVLIAVNWAYPLRAFSDPLGWGWNLIGTGNLKWNPLVPDLLPFIQGLIVFVGLFLAIRTTHHIGLNLFKDHNKAFRATAVMSVLHISMALLFIWILMG